MSKNWENGVSATPPPEYKVHKETVALKAIRLFISAHEMRLAAKHIESQAQTIRAGLQGDDITEFNGLHADWKMAQTDLKRKMAGDTGVGRFHISVEWEG